MQYILKVGASESGSRPPLQPWDDNVAPEGFVLCPDEMVSTFTAAKGFVSIEIENGAVISMTENTAARLAWELANPERPPEHTPEQDMMQMLVDQEYRLTLLELGVM